MVATWGLLKRSWDQIGGLVGVYSGPAGARNQHESHIKNMLMYRHDLLGCSSRGCLGSLGASLGALAQNIDIYGNWGLTLTPFWRAEATFHAYLRWISAWAKTCTIKEREARQ